MAWLRRRGAWSLTVRRGCVECQLYMDAIFLVMAMLFCPWLQMYTWSGCILIDSNSAYTVLEMYYFVLDMKQCQEVCDTEDRSIDSFTNFTLAYTLT